MVLSPGGQVTLCRQASPPSDRHSSTAKLGPLAVLQPRKVGMKRQAFRAVDLFNIQNLVSESHEDTLRVWPA